MQGLTSDEARSRRRQYGSNTLAEQARAHPVRIFFSQFTDIMVLILLAAAVISWLLGEYADAVTIAVIVVPVKILTSDQPIDDAIGLTAARTQYL